MIFLYSLLIIFLIIIFVNVLKKYQKTSEITIIYNSTIKIPYPIKQYYKNIIPMNIFQTWHTKNLPINMQTNSDMIKIMNPEFRYILYDDKDCSNFIKNNFGRDVLYAFNSLVPGAYKADLWRYCILYKFGGIYLDIKYKPVNNFKFINFIESEHWVLDNDGIGIYNALMICLPQNPILLKAINNIIYNVNTNFYGENSLEPTGPRLLGKYFSEYEKTQFRIYHKSFLNGKHRFIYFDNYIVLQQDSEYLTEHDNNKKQLHYSKLWYMKSIYG